jgi:hypothetical protein
MAILRIDCGENGLRLRPDPGAESAPRHGAAAPDLRGLAAAAADGPTVVMLHGWRYDPALSAADPHPLLYRDGPVPAARSRGGRVASWPVGLDLRDGGLAVGYGWRARYPHLAAFRGAGCNGFAAAYREAGRAGAALAPLLAALGEARAAPVDVFAHSLGARVALCALRALAEAGCADALSRLGRLILMGPAVFAGEARAALAACDRLGVAAPQIYAFHARGNAAFDALFAFAAPPEAERGDGPLGRAGLGERRPGWIDLAFDDPAAVAAFARLGVGLAPAASGPCHWSFYARPGAMALHRAILARAPGFCPEGLRAAAAPETAPARPAARFGWSPRPAARAAAPA